MEVMWLTGRLVPDHKTIADFRKDSGPAIRKVCAQFVTLCRRLDLFADASVAIDGSKFKAVNNRDRNFTRAKMKRRLEQIEESVARYLHQLDSADRQEPSLAQTTKTTRLKEKIETLKEEMQRLQALEARMHETPDQQISLTDPDARSMATSGRGSGVVGYNVQTAVDTQHHLIVTHDVTNVGTDRSQLSRVAKQTKATLGSDSLEVVADRGYFNSAEILACEEAGITVTLPKPLTSGNRAKGRFVKQDFRYIAEDDVYICPANERLTYRYTNEEKGLTLRRYWTNACLSCAIKHRCTTGRERRVTRWEHEQVLETVQRRARRAPREDAPAARDGRASLRHDQGAHGRNALPDEDTPASQNRDGAARPGLQPHAPDQHPRHRPSDGGDAGLGSYPLLAALGRRYCLGSPFRPRKLLHIAPTPAKTAKRRTRCKSAH